MHCSELLYCGPATTKKLESRGIHTIGDIAAADPEYLKRFLGVNGVSLWTYAAGLDQSRVMPNESEAPIKSIGHGITCVADLVNNEEVFRVMLELSQDVGHRLRVHKLAATGVQVWIRGDDLFGVQFQTKLPVKTQIPSEICSAGFDLFRKRYPWGTKVRAVCIRATGLVPKEAPEQLSLFDDAVKRRKMEKLQDAVEVLRGRFGKGAVTYATLLTDLKMPDDGRDKVRMPGMMYS